MFSARYSSGSLGVGAGFREQLLPVLLEGIGDVLEEDEPQDHVFLLRRVHRAPEGVGGRP